MEEQHPLTSGKTERQTLLQELVLVLLHLQTETSLLAAITAGATAAADFMTFTMSRVKINTDTVDDGETGLKRTYGYEALYNSAGGAALATQQTTIQVQDSAAP